MTTTTWRSQLVTAALVVSIGSVARPAFAQGTFRVTTPGTVFSVDGRAGRIAGDVADGRAFRGGAGESVILKGFIRIPPETSALPRLQKPSVVSYRARAHDCSRSRCTTDRTCVAFRPTPGATTGRG